jgi:fluoride ion exporter CrcB/FEX
MKQNALAKWLKFIIVGVGICGLLTYTVIMPRFAAYLVRQNSMLEKNVLPWLILIWISAIPCYIVLILGWKIADNIRLDRSFSY